MNSGCWRMTAYEETRVMALNSGKTLLILYIMGVSEFVGDAAAATLKITGKCLAARGSLTVDCAHEEVADCGEPLTTLMGCDRCSRNDGNVWEKCSRQYGLVFDSNGKWDWQK